MQAVRFSDAAVVAPEGRGQWAEVDGAVLGPSPCAGVYGTVHVGGVLRRGDVVTLADPAEIEGAAVDDPATQAGFQAMGEEMELLMAQLRPR